MSDEREPLWSDTEIAEIIAGMASKWEAAILYSILRGKRDAYEARIAELEQQVANKEALIVQLVEIDMPALEDANERLEAQLAQTWQPLPDGEVGSFTYIDNGGKSLGVYAGNDYTDWYATDDLPDNIRLCRLVERAEVQPTEVDHE